MLYLLGALDGPSSGSIRVAGRDLTTMSEHDRDDYRRNQVGFIYQSFNLIGNLSAVDNVLLPFIPVGVDSSLRDKAVDLLKQVGLGHRLKLRPRQMSGGEQQRVAIACALIKIRWSSSPTNPTGNLDRAGGDRIIHLLRERQQAHSGTVVIVTHDRRFITPDDLVLEIEDGVLKTVPVESLSDEVDAPEGELIRRRDPSCGYRIRPRRCASLPNGASVFLRRSSINTNGENSCRATLSGYDFSHLTIHRSRIEEGDWLADRYSLIAIYLYGYAAEMSLKAAYFRNLRLGATGR